jgi:hypothetical protein
MKWLKIILPLFIVAPLKYFETATALQHVALFGENKVIR